MFITDATIHIAHDSTHALHNPAPESLIFTIWNVQKETLRSLTEIFGKETSPAVLPRAPVIGVYHENSNRWTKKEYKSNPFTNEEPYWGAYIGDISRKIPTSALSKKTGKIKPSKNSVVKPRIMEICHKQILGK